MKKLIYLLLAGVGLFCSCKKGFLDAKPSSSIVNPTTFDQLQGLLENTEIINKSTPALPLLSGDDYIFTDYQSWQGAYTATERNAYIWAKDIYAGETDVRDWSYPYKTIFYCNNVIEGLDNITASASTQERWNNLMGWALFVRALKFYELAKNFSPPYDQATATTDLGIPLKLKAGVDEILPRASLQQTYDQIFADLKKAILLLQKDISASYRNRPSKVAAYALTSRVYLSMRDYDKANLYADSTLNLYNKLIDYNTVDSLSSTPFSITNDETIYNASMVDRYYITTTRTYNTMVTVNPALIGLYIRGDLRLPIYFTANDAAGVSVKSQYKGGNDGLPFTGLATDEVYLIKAECLARLNKSTEAMSVLNQLLIKRYKTGKFTSVTASTSNDALDKILIERRKELVWRDLRWEDLRRLNKQGAGITLTRILNGQTYTLAPNSPLYTFPIPDQEITLSGIFQNAR